MKIKNLLRYLLYGGSHSLKILEGSLIEAMQKKLSPENAHAVSGQINTINLVQRSNKNRMIVFFRDDKKIVPLIDDHREALCLCKIKYSINSCEYKTLIFFHRGRISSLETEKGIPSSHLKERPIINAIELFCFSEKTLDSAIDEEEHDY